MINALGEKHGTITARINDTVNFEVTTLRIDKVKIIVLMMDYKVSPFVMFVPHPFCVNSFREREKREDNNNIVQKVTLSDLSSLIIDIVCVHIS